MKRTCSLLAAILLVLGFAATAQATLILRGKGTSAYGTYNLIYDDDLDITWYDYMGPSPTSAGMDDMYNWQNQVNWASWLSVTFGSNTYTDWRLPETVDGPYSWGYDGTTTAGYNITSSEMGHLFYTELGNLGVYDTAGNPQSGYGFNNTGPFQNLIDSVYWSGTEHSAVPGSEKAWVFSFNVGEQTLQHRSIWYYALAVHPGDVSAGAGSGGGGPAPIPEPSTWLLIGAGLLRLVGYRARI